MLVQKCVIFDSVLFSQRRISVIFVDDFEKMPKLFLAKFDADNLPKFALLLPPTPVKKTAIGASSDP